MFYWSNKKHRPHFTNIMEICLHRSSHRANQVLHYARMLQPNLSFSGYKPAPSTQRQGQGGGNTESKRISTIINQQSWPYGDNIHTVTLTNTYTHNLPSPTARNTTTVHCNVRTHGRMWMRDYKQVLMYIVQSVSRSTGPGNTAIKHSALTRHTPDNRIVRHPTGLEGAPRNYQTGFSVSLLVLPECNTHPLSLMSYDFFLLALPVINVSAGLNKI